MKKSGAILAACLLSVALTACGTAPAAPAGSAEPAGSGSAPVEPAAPAGSAEPSSGSGSSAWADDPNTRVYRDCSITVLDYSLHKDRDGDLALRVTYRFQNNSQSRASFSTTVIPSAYQGDSEEPLAYATPAEADPEYSAMLTQLDPQESILCAGYFKLCSADSPVELEVKDLLDSSAEALRCTLDIAGLTVEEAVPEAEN